MDAPRAPADVKDVHSRIAAAIDEAETYVARMPPTAGSRELKARLETFRRTLASWGTVNRPTAEQIDALLDRVREVRRLATDRAPTVRRRKVDE